ncbi:MAG: DUF3137 domain-containing protein [Acholeplasmataceae bacterium]
MNEKLIQIEAKRKKLYEQYSSQMKKAIMIALLIGASVGLVFSLIPDFRDVSLYFFGLFIIPLIMGATATKYSKTFRDIIKSELITVVLEDKFDEVQYNQHASISQATIDFTGMVKQADRFKGEDYIRGSYNGVQFETSDVEMRERVEHVDSKGNRTVSYPIYFKGRWYVFRFEKTLDGALKICESYPRSRQGLEKFDTESIQFNKKFKLYASDKQFAFYHLNPIMMEKLLELEKMHRGKIYFYYAGNELHIGVNDNQDYLEMPFRKEINQESIKVFEGDIDLIPAIIKEMKLDSRKFKK